MSDWFEDRPTEADLTDDTASGSGFHADELHGADGTALNQIKDTLGDRVTLIAGFADLVARLAALDTTVATKQTAAQVATAIAAVVDSAPATLDTLNELAAALGDDPNFATTTATLIGTKETPAGAQAKADAAQAAAIAAAIQRSAHTGTQLAVTISDFTTAVQALIAGARRSGALHVGDEAATATTLTTSAQSVIAQAVAAGDLAAGEVVEFEATIALLNNSGANRNYTVDTIVGGTTVASQVLAAIGANATARLLRVRCRGIIKAANDSNWTTEIGVGATNTGPSTQGTAYAETDGVTVDFSSGARTFDIQVTSNSAAISQEATVRSWSIRRHIDV